MRSSLFGPASQKAEDEWGGVVLRQNGLHRHIVVFGWDPIWQPVCCVIEIRGKGF